MRQLERLPTRLLTYISRRRAFLFAAGFALLYALTALVNRSHDAYFLYTGDVLGFYWPSMTKVINMLKGFNFTGVDVSLFNGSADFFLSSNFFSCHPILVAYAFLTAWKSQSAQMVGQLLVLMIVAHNFFACYFTLKLARRFFGLAFGYAAFVAVFFSFSFATISSYGEPEQLFCTSVMPWCIYAALRFEALRRLRDLPLAALPVIFAVLGGYIPLGMACLLLAAVTVAGYIVFFDGADEPLEMRLRRVAVAACPFVVGAIVVGPYLLAVYLFLQESPSAHQASLFFSAHQLSELPQSIARVLSFHYSIPGPLYEISTFWGFIAVTICLLFVSSSSAFQRFSPREWTIFKASAIIYFATLLSVFGVFSPTSAIIYYLVPQIGTMHIYQRFLYPANLALAMMLALMLKALIQAHPAPLFRGAALAWIVLTVGSAVVLAKAPAAAAAVGVDNFVVYEMILASLFALSLLVPDTAFRLFAVVVLWSLPTLDLSYGDESSGYTLADKARQQPMMLDPNVRAPFLAYLRKHTDKALIKYFDYTPLWSEKGVEPFPKSFPYLVMNEINLSSYDGFNFYLSPQANYMRLMPVGAQLRQQPDWDWLRATGADFLIIRQSDLKQVEALGALEDVSLKDTYSLPDGVVAVPLKRSGNVNDRQTEEPLFDNGYMKVTPAHPDLTKDVQNIALGKPARQISTLGAGEAARAVDGNTDGDFSHGSVTHTGSDANAWFEIDLGSDEAIDAVKIWNRADCCQERLRNFWTFISPRPFGDSASAQTVRADPAVWRHLTSKSSGETTITVPSVRGRYVRIQLAGDSRPGDDYLSLAEVQVLQAVRTPRGSDTAGGPPTSVVFSSNNANRFGLDVNAGREVDVDYQLWGNPKFSFYLDGRRVVPSNVDGIQRIRVPEGKHGVDIVYRNWPLAIFWLFYGAFAVVLLASAVVAIVANPRWRRLKQSSPYTRD